MGIHVFERAATFEEFINRTLKKLKDISYFEKMMWFESAIYQVFQNSYE